MDKQHPDIPVSNASAHTRPLHKNAVILGGEPEEWEIQARLSGGTRGGLGSRPAQRQPARLQVQNQIPPTAEEPFQKVLGQTSSLERVNNPPRGSRGGHRPRLDEEQSQRLEAPGHGLGHYRTTPAAPAHAAVLQRFCRYHVRA
ncbi:hypothetical protein D4764_20G0000330 [Takifugu flavidus]|uniref:Uncharacterized protein n=1 Tax=Takifugu flavidus TaxID=433684 RepID=A0A5C6NH62_9TELE|nr:hypothetical protein D4764_20G0000330 [Takifugu flavidus]